ncbi:MAG: ArsR/SmtB family transcription factor [Candidatus Hodarchaeales archaeon]|jgi:DNA-binding transcriptional ArsR family regulator
MIEKKKPPPKELEERITEFLAAIPLCSCSSVEDHLEELNRSIPTENKLEPLVEFFKLFSNINRLKIVFLLMNKSPRCNCEIEALLEIGQSTISHHIQVLEENKIIHAEKKGKWSLYSLENQSIKKIFAQVMDAES